MLLCSISITTYSSKEIYKTTGRIKITWSFCKDWTRFLCGYKVFVSLCFLPSKQIISERHCLVLFFLYWYCPKYRTKITILALKLGIQMEIFLLVKTQKRLWIKRWLRANIQDRRSSFSSEILSEMIQHGTISHSEQLLRVIFHFTPHGSSCF